MTVHGLRSVALSVQVLLLSVASVVLAQDSVETRLVFEPVLLFNQHLYYGSFDRPRGVVFDRAHGEIWVADTAEGILSVHRPNGTELYAATSRDVVKEPVRIALAPNGDIVVVEGDRTHLRRLSYRGEYKGDVPLPDLGEKPIIGAAVYDAEGNLYVAENRSAQIFVYAPDGKLKRQFGSRGSDEGQFQSVCAIAIATDGSIVVADQQALAVQVFDHQGNFLRGWGRHEMGADNFSLPSGIALDSRGNVIVADELRHQVKAFSREGKLLAAAGGLGSGLGQMSFPTDVTVDGLDRVYVSERGNSRVQVFQLTLATVAADE